MTTSWSRKYDWGEIAAAVDVRGAPINVKLSLERSASEPARQSSAEFQDMALPARGKIGSLDI